MKPPVDTRIQCPFCGTRTWSRDYIGFMRDHDRPDGRVCRKAQVAQSTKETWLGVCEHGDHPAPENRRFCSAACARCETESVNEETGCDGICLKEAT